MLKLDAQRTNKQSSSRSRLEVIISLLPLSGSTGRPLIVQLLQNPKEDGIERASHISQATPMQILSRKTGH